jgi:hypothetical protein
MLIKQDFSNLLVKEIFHLQYAVSLINKEIDCRLEMNVSHKFETALEKIQNDRTILALKNELKSKSEYLYKLKEKELHDAPFIEEDFLNAVNGFEEAKEKIATVKDPHDQARCKYLAEEIELWLKKETLPEYKEAVGFYFKGLKMSLRDSGIDI